MAVARERVYPGVPPLQAGAGLVPTPFQFLLTGEDNLRVAVITHRTGVRMSIRGRFLEKDGRTVTPFAYTFNPNTIGTESAHDFQMGEGAILNLVIGAITAAIQPGEVYVRADVVRGTGATIVLGTLIAGYVGSWGGRAWPGTPLQMPSDGRGRIRTLVAGVFPAGVEASLRIDNGVRWRVISVVGILQTSAVVATRNISLALEDPPNALWYGQTSIAQLAGTAIVHVWGAGVDHGFAAGQVVAQGSIPHEAYLTGINGFGANQMITSTNNMQAGDQWLSLKARVEEWVEADADLGLSGF